MRFRNEGIRGLVAVGLPAVRRTLDFERIAALPRRELTLADDSAWAVALSDTCLLSGPGAFAFKPWQALVVGEVVANGGGLLGLPVGFGKTPLGVMIAVALDLWPCVLILPANGGAGLREKTISDFASYRGKLAMPDPPPMILTGSDLSTDANADLLERIAPAVIIIDEADDFQNADSAACRRIDRYVAAHPEVVVVAMSGTLMRKSIMGFWHLAGWALRERMPLPLKRSEAREWGLAVDDYGLRSGVRRPHPGPLGDDLESARAWLADRLWSTPGMVSIDEDSAGDMPLHLEARLAPECQALNGFYDRFLLEAETPDGHTVSDPLSRWRMDGDAGCGFYRRWRKPPPEPWRIAYRALNKFVRDAIEASTRTPRPIDTELQVMRRHHDHPVVQAWVEIRDTFDGETEPVWISASALEAACEWLGESDAPGIVWVSGPEFGRALAGLVGLQYFGAKGRDDLGNALHAVQATRSIVVSWQANKKGFDNLKFFRRALIVHPPQSAKWLEQLFGRHHRRDVPFSPVLTVLLTSGGTIDSWYSALSEADTGAEITRMTQKILRADVAELPRPRVTAANKHRWASRRKAA